MMHFATRREFTSLSRLWRSCTASAHPLLRMACMSAAQQAQSLRVTWLEVGPRAYHLIAGCACCAVVVERRIDDIDGDEIVLHAIGTELLAAHGCTHVDDPCASGMRPALRRRS
jgi:hypothetical protein